MNNITINGLEDGISILEYHNVASEPAYEEDILYNDQEPFNLNINDFYISEENEQPYFHVQDFGEFATLLSTITLEEAILGKTKTI